MYKVLLFFRKHCIIGYILFCSIIWQLFECFLPSYENIKIIVSSFIPALLYFWLNKYICIGYPFRSLIMKCNVKKCSEELNTLKESLKPDQKKFVDQLEQINRYFTQGPTKEFITDIEKLIESNPELKDGYFTYLCYTYIETQDVEKATQIINDYKKKAKLKNKSTILLIYKLIIENDNISKEQLIAQDHKKTTLRIKKTLICYYLSLYYKQNNKTDEEKEYLEKVIELGNNTYMAKNAKQRLENIK